MNKNEINTFFQRLEKHNPYPRIELEYTNPFTLLVAVLLSAQSTDVRVNIVTRDLFQIADTPERLLALSETKLCHYIRSIGLFKTKARNLLRLSHILQEKYAGKVPQDRESLEALPGVGRKTANVVLNVAFGQSTIAVDRHIFRVVNRCGLGSGTTPLKVEQGLEKNLPAKWKPNAHHWLVLHGRYVCKAQKPLCTKCVVYDLCRYPKKYPKTKPLPPCNPT